MLAPRAAEITNTPSAMIFSKPVVAGVDFSPASAQVLRQAARIAVDEGVPLLAVHVVNFARLPHRPGGCPPTRCIDDAVHQARRLLAQMVESYAGGAMVRPIVLAGNPAEQLHRLVQREQAGLLVLSANHPKRPRKLGPVACRCVRTVPCDVLLLRDRKEERFQRVVACVDLSTTSESVIGRAIEASRSGAALDIVHVMYPPDRDVWGGMLDEDAEDFAEESREETRLALQRVTRGFLDELRPLSHQARILESAAPSVELTCHIGDTRADLVVLGTRSHSKLGACFLGTNAERLMHDAPVSVLAVRA